MTRKAAPVVGLTRKQKERVAEIREEIMSVVDEFVPGTDATRVGQDLDQLIKILSDAAGAGHA